MWGGWDGARTAGVSLSCHLLWAPAGKGGAGNCTQETPPGRVPRNPRTPHSTLQTSHPSFTAGRGSSVTQRDPSNSCHVPGQPPGILTYADFSVLVWTAPVPRQHGSAMQPGRQDVGVAHAPFPAMSVPSSAAQHCCFLCGLLTDFPLLIEPPRARQGGLPRSAAAAAALGETAPHHSLHGQEAGESGSGQVQGLAGPRRPCPETSPWAHLLRCQLRRYPPCLSWALCLGPCTQ